MKLEPVSGDIGKHIDFVGETTTASQVEPEVAHLRWHLDIVCFDQATTVVEERDYAKFGNRLKSIESSDRCFRD